MKEQTDDLQKLHRAVSALRKQRGGVISVLKGNVKTEMVCVQRRWQKKTEGKFSYHISKCLALSRTGE